MPVPESQLSAARRGQIPGLLETQTPLLMGEKSPMQPSLAEIASKTFAVSWICSKNCRRWQRNSSGITAELTAEQQPNNSRITAESIRVTAEFIRAAEFRAKSDPLARRVRRIHRDDNKVINFIILLLCCGSRRTRYGPRRERRVEAFISRRRLSSGG